MRPVMKNGTGSSKNSINPTRLETIQELYVESSLKPTSTPLAYIVGSDVRRLCVYKNYVYFSLDLGTV